MLLVAVVLLLSQRRAEAALFSAPSWTAVLGPGGGAPGGGAGLGVGSVRSHIEFSTERVGGSAVELFTRHSARMANAVAAAVGHGVRGDDVRILDVEDSQYKRVRATFELLNLRSAAATELVAATLRDAAFQPRMHAALQRCSRPPAEAQGAAAIVVAAPAAAAAAGGAGPAASAYAPSPMPAPGPISAISREKFEGIFPALADASGASCSAHCAAQAGAAGSLVAGNCPMYAKGGYGAFTAVAKQFMFPDRTGAAARDFVAGGGAADDRGFLAHENPLVNAKELAAFFSNVFQETGLQEWASPWASHAVGAAAAAAAAEWELRNATAADEVGAAVAGVNSDNGRYGGTVALRAGFTPAWGVNPLLQEALCYSFERGAEEDGWLGRGVVQLTGDSNYAQASFGMDRWDSLLCARAAAEARVPLPPPRGVGADLCAHKHLAATDVHMAWRTGIWFWMNKWVSPGAQWGYEKYGKRTSHALLRAAPPGDFGAPFAASVQQINGGLECLRGEAQGFSSRDRGGGFSRTARRANAYVYALEQLGVPAMVAGWDARRVWQDAMSTCFRGGAWESRQFEQVGWTPPPPTPPPPPPPPAAGVGGGGVGGVGGVGGGVGGGGGVVVTEGGAALAPGSASCQRASAPSQADGSPFVLPQPYEAQNTSAALPLPWAREEHSVCGHGGDPSSCSGHGGCGAQTYNEFAMPLGTNGLQAHWPTLKPASAATLASPTGNKCICDEGWAGKACSVNVAAPASERVDPRTLMPAWNGLTYDVANKPKDCGRPGAAGWSQYMQLAYASGTCVQSWTFRPAESLPYSLRAPQSHAAAAAGAWQVGPRIQGVTASNNLQYGERIIRPGHNYPNPSVTCHEGSLNGDWQPSGQNCGQCWELTLHDGTRRSVVALDRCGGGCYGYPAQPPPASAGCVHQARFEQFAAKGANWRRLVDDGESEACLKLLTRDDCANFFIGAKGFEPEPDRAGRDVVCAHESGGSAGKGGAGPEKEYFGAGPGRCVYAGTSTAASPTMGYALAMAVSSAITRRLEVPAHPSGGRPRRRESEPTGDPQTEGYRQVMKRAQNTEWVDHCAANYVPHFDIDLDSTICLGIDGVGTVAAYEPVPCTPVGAKPEGGYVKGVGWLRGCDRNGWTNCGDVKPFVADQPNDNQELCK